MSAPPILEVTGLHAGYGGAGQGEVLRGVDLRVPRGAVVALLGPNGAGKTTLLRVIAGLLPPTRGDVHLAGVHVGGAAPEALARAGLCLVPEGRGVFPNLTVEENLRLASQAGVPVAAMVEGAFQRFPRLAPLRRTLAGRLCRGDQQALSLARALGSDPALLLLDELGMGVPPAEVDELYAAVAQAASGGVSVVVAEQFAHCALEIADYGTVLRDGRVVAWGEPAELAALLVGGTR